MTPKQQIKKIENDIEGILNDFESGIADKDQTIISFGNYIYERAEAAINNYKKSLPVEAGVKPATCGHCVDCKHFLDLDTPYINFACNHPNIKLEMAIPDRETFGCTYFESKLSI